MLARMLQQIIQMSAYFSEYRFSTASKPLISVNQEPDVPDVRDRRPIF